MSGRLSEREITQIARLLQTLAREELPIRLDVADRVARRAGRLPLPGTWAPLVSLREFGWSAACAAALLVLAAVGLAGSLRGVGHFEIRAAAEALSHLYGAFAALGAAAARIVLGLMANLDGFARWANTILESQALFAVQTALGVCTVLLILTILVVSHDARARRIS